LVPPRVEAEGTFSNFAGFSARLAGATFVLLGVLRCDIFQILSVVTAHAPSPPKPHSGGIASGAGSQMGQQTRINTMTLTLSLQPKSSRFCKENWAPIGSALQG